MTVYEAARSILLDALGGAVGQRVRPDRCYEGDALPRAAVRITGQTVLDLLGGVGGVQYAGEVSIWAASRQEADQLAESVLQQDGVEVDDNGRVWIFFIEGHSADADLAAEESDRPEYRADVSFALLYL